MDAEEKKKKKKRDFIPIGGAGDYVRGIIDSALAKWGTSRSGARSGYKNANVQLEALDRDKASR